MCLDFATSGLWNDRIIVNRFSHQEKTNEKPKNQNQQPLCEWIKNISKPNSSRFRPNCSHCLYLHLAKSRNNKLYNSSKVGKRWLCMMQIFFPNTKKMLYLCNSCDFSAIRYFGLGYICWSSCIFRIFHRCTSLCHLFFLLIWLHFYFLFCSFYHSQNFQGFAMSSSLNVDRGFK